MIRQRSVAVTTAAAPLPVLLVLVPLLLVAAVGCEEEAGDLTVPDLDEGELRYVQRVMTLERARAVALVDRPVGDALLDSLAAAWGDSSLPETVAGLPDEPARAAAVGELLGRMLLAEQDSLILAPRPDRLSAPLPEPEPRPDDAEPRG